jgi:hypothetical protein
VPRYICHGGRVERGSSSCLTIGGLRVDRAVETAVLDALQPAGVTAAVEALERMRAEHDITRQAFTLALEKARYEAQRAQRQYDRVDPDNRLVAGELERRWNETLTQVAEAEARLATLAGQPITLSEEQRHGLLTLGHDLATVWYHPAAPEALKKRILRTVLSGDHDPHDAGAARARLASALARWGAYRGAGGPQYSGEAWPGDRARCP